MKKSIFIVALAAIVGLCTSCKEKSNAEVTIHAINDNAQPQLMAPGIFTGAADSIAQALGLGDGIPASMNAFLVETAGKQILFDAGNGGNNSQLLPELNKLGVTPEDIDLIFITHMHGDHIGGLVTDNKAVFSNAKIYINAKELEAWMNMPEERNAQVRGMAEAYGNQIVTFAVTDQLPCNIQPIAAYGHTEGHTLYRMGNILIVGDIMHGVALQLENPEICARFDGNLEQTIESRKATLELAKKENLRMYGMHFPTPHYIELAQ
ncbi:MAG: MBL fold metallo-hydrolase [Bacteroides sp.]|nr:MBL fold metallo-hydrolase [Bacteroides sp.]